MPGRTVTLGLMLLLATVALSALAAGLESLVYVATDSYDTAFIGAGVGAGILPPGPIIGLDGVATQHLPRVVALFDPNWGAGEAEAALLAARRLVDHMVEGGIVVAGLNGATMLNMSLKKQGMPLPPVTHAACAPAPENYLYAKYGCLPQPPGSRPVRLPGNMTAYILHVGDGWLVIIPYNIVWAYMDTRDRAYLEAAAGALEVASSLPAANEGLAALAAAAAAAAAVATASQAARGKDRGGEEGRGESGEGGGRDGGETAPVLGVRVDREDALRHPLRRQIVELVEAVGALSFNQLWREVGAAKATVAWHLSVLERLGILSSVQYKRYLMVYKRGPEGVKALFRALASRDRGFCRLVEAALSSIPLEEVARRLRASPKGLSRIYDLIKNYHREAEEVCRGVD